MKATQRVVAALAGAAVVVVGASAQQKMQINGAGATFPYPIYSKWFSEYDKLHANVEINYQPIDSGGGIRQIVLDAGQAVEVVVSEDLRVTARIVGGDGGGVALVGNGFDI